jgi:hypothetical protein
MSEETTQEQEVKIMTKHEFFFELPLYTAVPLSILENPQVGQFFSGDVDAYSPSGFETTYTINRWYLGNSDSIYNGYFAVSLSCKRKGETLEFFVYNNGESLIKVGQFLSLADLQYAEIGKDYDKVLDAQDLHDLKKAIGLMAHGAGAGSLVYLRRIFENIIWNTYENHAEATKTSAEDFKVLRMDEKVELLKAFLPSQLVEMKVIYGILSKGIHQPSEQECLAYFPALKLSITLILDQRVEEQKVRAKDEETKKTLASIAKEIHGK